MTAGQIVCSKAGRDKGRFFVILKAEEDFAWIADGDLRPLARPKRKRQKHLAPTSQRANEEDVQTDKRLRKLLTNYQTRSTQSAIGGNKLVEE